MLLSKPLPAHQVFLALAMATAYGAISYNLFDIENILTARQSHRCRRLWKAAPKRKRCW